MEKEFLIAVSLDDINFRENLSKAKELDADAVEYRIDSFQNTDLEHCREVINFGNSLGLKGILTIRAPWEGGKKEIPGRVEYYEELTPLVNFVDIELKAPEKEEVKNIVKNTCKKLILSYHDFEKTPCNEEIEQIFAEMVSNGADVAKVSFYANDYSDVQRLLCVAAKQPIPTVAISMGDKGKISRVAGFVFNSIITYCALEKPFAPGQLTVKEAVELRKKFFGL
jgi:3-dehydroquinate dehydratase-1